MSYTLKELCLQLGVDFTGNENLEIIRVCGLDRLLPHSVVFLTTSSDLEKIPLSSELAVIAPTSFKSDRHNLIFSDDPLALHAQVTQILHPGPQINNSIHPTAVLGQGVELGEGVTIDAHVVLYDNVKIGSHSVLRAGAVIMENSSIGESCLIFPNVTVREDCHLGSRVIVHAGSVIGSDGYGFFQRAGKHYKIPQVGGVIIEDDVEIGAACTIDRARFYNTLIRQGSKFDNQVHIAHNVEIGEHSLLTAQVGIAGSVRTGHHLVMGGQSGIVDQLKIGNEVVVLARGLVIQDVPDQSIIGGAPGRPAKKWRKLEALFNRLEQLFTRVKRLEKQLTSSSESKKEKG